MQYPTAHAFSAERTCNLSSSMNSVRSFALPFCAADFIVTQWLLAWNTVRKVSHIILYTVSFKIRRRLSRDQFSMARS